MRAPEHALLGDSRWSGRVYGPDGWQAAAGGTIPVTEPATGAVIGEAGCAGPEDVSVAATVATEAQPGWAAESIVRRAEFLRRAALLLGEHREEVRTWIVRESGSAQLKAAAEVDGAVELLWQAAAMPTQPLGELLPSADPERTSMAVRTPHGVVAVIAPWNFPLVLALRSVAPALAVGNAVVLKPDVQTAVCGGILLARLFEEAGLEPGIFQVLPGGADVGEALVTDPNVEMVSFTGSTAVGRRVGELAGKHLKRTALELGGKNAFVVLDGADVDAASSAGAWSSFLHQGQICMSAGRHLVHERVADAYVEALARRADALPVGDPNTEEVALGPLISERQLERVDGVVRDAVGAGAELASGGRAKGLFYRPVVLAGVKPGMRAFEEEIFGPVAPVLTFRDDDEAVALANHGGHGLAAGVHAPSAARGLEVARRLRAGMVHVNDQTINGEAHAPFGGVGSSGDGSRLGGSANWETFAQWRWITIRDRQSTHPY